MKILIGIDPGVHTGICMMQDGKISLLATVDFWKAIDIIDSAYPICASTNLSVVIEDPSQNKPTFARSVEGLKKQSRISQNVGSNKREATLLIEYCKRNGIDVVAIKPTKRSLTKLPAETFKKLTGWEGQSSEHSRDAAMLIWVMK